LKRLAEGLQESSASSTTVLVDERITAIQERKEDEFKLRNKLAEIPVQPEPSSSASGSGGPTVDVPQTKKQPVDQERVQRQRAKLAAIKRLFS